MSETKNTKSKNCASTNLICALPDGVKRPQETEYNDLFQVYKQLHETKELIKAKLSTFHRNQLCVCVCALRTLSEKSTL